MADRMGSGTRYYASTGYSTVMRLFYRDVCFNIGSNRLLLCTTSNFYKIRSVYIYLITVVQHIFL